MLRSESIPVAQKIDIEVHRYPLLRLVSLLYKIAAVLVFLLALLGALLGAGTALTLRTNLLVALGSGALGFLLAGGLGGLGLYTFARLIDLFLDTNNSTRQIAAAIEEQNRLLRQMSIRRYEPYPRPEEKRALSGD